MVSSEIAIYNLAIAKMGHEGFISDSGEANKASRIFGQIYAPLRDDVLRSHLWRFARKRAILAPLTTTPSFDGGKYFQYPDDCLRIIGTNDDYTYSGARWFREGDKILADTDVLYLVYLEKVTDVARFDPSFVNALACRLAMESVMSITKDSGMKQYLEKEYDKAIIRAAHNSATEQDGSKFISEAFIGAR